jgi:chorismate dehydratase
LQLAVEKIPSAILELNNSPVNKLRISVVQYLNTAPLVWGFTHGPLRGKYELSFTVPSQCAEQLRAGVVDVAIIPAIECQRIPGLAILQDMAIASKKEVRSLLIVSKRPIGQVESLALDRSSRSTQALTRILCDGYWRIAPEFTEAVPDLRTMLQQADAALLIGDPALRFAIKTEPHSQRVANHGSQTVPLHPQIHGWTCRADAAGLSPDIGELFVYDIVEQWCAMTGLPAVLAVWAARRDVATPDVAADFLQSRDYGLARIKEICSSAATELGLPQSELESYLRQNIDFSLDDENRRGLELYFEYSAKLGLIPEAKPIAWVAAKTEMARP